jgi:hypothetical protein
MVVLIVMITFISLLLAVAHLSGHDPKEEGRTLAVGAISSMLGSLYGYLGNSGPKSPTS